MTSLKDVLWPSIIVFVLLGISFPKIHKKSNVILRICVIINFFIFTGCLRTIYEWTSTTIYLRYVSTDKYHPKRPYVWLNFVMQCVTCVLDIIVLHQNKTRLRRLVDQLQDLTRPKEALQKATRSYNVKLALLTSLCLISVLYHTVQFSYSLLFVVCILPFNWAAFSSATVLTTVLTIQSFTSHRFLDAVRQIHRSKSPLRRRKLLKTLSQDELQFRKIFQDLERIFSPILMLTLVSSMMSMTSGMALIYQNESNAELGGHFIRLFVQIYSFCILLLIVKANGDHNRKLKSQYFSLATRLLNDNIWKNDLKFTTININYVSFMMTCEKPFIIPILGSFVDEGLTILDFIAIMNDLVGVAVGRMALVKTTMG